MLLVPTNDEQSFNNTISFSQNITNDANIILPRPYGLEKTTQGELGSTEAAPHLAICTYISLGFRPAPPAPSGQ